MKPPQGLKLSQLGLVCRLKKFLYGLKQASWQWNHKLTSALCSFGFQQSTSDFSFIVKTHGTFFTALLIYVDDVILAGNYLTEINIVKPFLNSQFHIKDLGQLKYFLGKEVARSTKDLLLNQRKYCLELLHEFDLLGCKLVVSPIDSSNKLTVEGGDLLGNPTVFRRLIRRLIYLTNTRPDISFVVQHLSRYVSQARQPHLQSAFRILKYLKTSPGSILLQQEAAVILSCKHFLILSGLHVLILASLLPIIVFFLAKL
jgi:hypothetical protein